VLWIALVASALALYAGGELAARHWTRVRKRYYVCLPGLRLELRLDRGVLPDLEPVVRFEINADGERGSDVGPADDHLYRILVAGGSAVEGYFLDQASHWPGVLERLLSQPATRRLLRAARVHVGSIGRSGVASRDLAVILERVLPQYRRLDAILIMVGASDVLGWLACGAPTDAPAPPAPVSGVFASHPDGPFGWRPSRSAAIELLKGWWRLRFRPLRVRGQAGRWLGEARAMRAAATEVRTAVPDPTVMLDNFGTCFSRLLQCAKAACRRVVVVRQPWFEKAYTPAELAHFWDGAVGYPWKELVTVYYAIDVVNRLMAQVDARAAQVAEELGVEHVDLRSLLEPSLTTYYDHWHFTPAGARQAAEAVAAALLRQRVGAVPSLRAS
jgi:lysophospholipase L1-like esterase